jgi:hypothetical protein
VGDAGVAVPTATVVTLGGFEARFVAVNVNGPPNDPVVIFCKVNVAGFGVLVNVQTIFAKSLRLTAGTVIVLPAKLPKLAGLPDVCNSVIDNGDGRCGASGGRGYVGWCTC